MLNAVKESTSELLWISSVQRLRANWSKVCEQHHFIHLEYFINYDIITCTVALLPFSPVYNIYVVKLHRTKMSTVRCIRRCSQPCLSGG